MEITPHIAALVKMAFAEDLADKGDITSQSTIDPNKTISASMISREDGIIAGVDLANYVFQQMPSALTVEIYLNEGDKVTKEQKILTVSGNAQDILSSERIALNFLTHLSGIATETSKYVAAVAHTNAKILDTRKTLPAYRVLAKHAVKMGGGQNHRMGLHDMVLIKDNHIAAAGGIANAFANVRKLHPNVKTEIEVDTLDQLREVLTLDGVDFALLDNMTPEQLKEAVSIVDGKIQTEASGGINMNSIVSIAESGVDYISIGALTHSVMVFDIGLDITE